MQYAVFLRAINVGSHNRIKMDELKKILLELHCSSVTTYLQTGNILLESELSQETLAITLETVLLEKAFKDAFVFVRTRAEMQQLLEIQPFGKQSETHHEYISLLRQPSTLELPAPKGFEIVQHEAQTVFTRVLNQPNSVQPNAWLEKHLKVKATTRYWRVVEDVIGHMGL